VPANKRKEVRINAWSCERGAAWSCERGAGRRQALKFDFINSWLMELNSDQQPTERDRKGTSCPSPATTY
jgi:hypothetical protein